MKKLIPAIITLSIITLNGCYDPDTATVRINLGNIPIAKHEPKSLLTGYWVFLRRMPGRRQLLNMLIKFI